MDLDHDDRDLLRAILARQTMRQYKRKANINGGLIATGSKRPARGVSVGEDLSLLIGLVRKILSLDSLD